MKSKVRIIKLNDSGDTRGYSFTVPAEALEFLSRIRDVHLASIAPAPCAATTFICGGAKPSSSCTTRNGRCTGMKGNTLRRSICNSLAREQD